MVFAKKVTMDKILVWIVWKIIVKGRVIKAERNDIKGGYINESIKNGITFRKL